ncbi:MAG: response regulator transcription factor [Nitrospirae bacterium]|nr:MAG: response regulator transcription factor [Nitrospirota bacterium]
MRTLERATSQASLLLVAGPDAKLRHQWRQGLPGKTTIQEVSEQGELERSLTAIRPAVLLLDLALCASEGIGRVPALQLLSPSTKIVLLTATPDAAEGVYALKVGAKGYCTRDITPPLLRKALEMILEGQIWVERSVIPYLLGELSSLGAHKAPAAAPQEYQPDSPLDCLTPRERAVADLIAAGAWNKEIACRLNITEATVKAHLTAIFRKLGVTDRLRLGLLLTRYANGPSGRAQPVEQA